jgi:hypothetical protein
MSKTIIGLAGPKQSGKTSAAGKLEKSGFVRYSFASPLRRMLAALLDDLGHTEAEINYFLHRDKVQVIPGLLQSSRVLLQTLGTEWGRTHVHPDLWVLAARRRIESSKDDLIVFDDVRFENEAALIRDLGGLIIHVDRGDLVLTDTHASESRLVNHPEDAVVNNDYTLDDFLLDVSIVVAGFIGR